MRATILTVVALLSAPLASAHTWGVLDVVARNVSPDDTATYRELFQSELSRAVGAGGVVTLIAGQCSDPGCAALAGQKAGVEYVVMLTMGTLGQKLITTAAVIESSSGNPLRSEKMTVDRIEDLEAVAGRFALAFAGNKPIENTAELGKITEVERRPAKRRHGDGGVSLRVKGVLPLMDTLAGINVGMGFDLGYWYEAEAFSIEPRLGVRFDAKSDDRQFWIVPIDIGANYIFGLGDFTPFIGGGMGARYVYQSVHLSGTETVSDGAFVTTTTERAIDEDSIQDGWGFGLFGRVGVLLFRTYSVRMTIEVEYDATFVDLGGGTFPQTFQFSAGVIF